VQIAGLGILLVRNCAARMTGEVIKIKASKKSGVSRCQGFEGGDLIANNFFLQNPALVGGVLFFSSFESSRSRGALLPS
jgi:hypothetical protein